MPKTISITEAGRKDLEKERKELIARRPEIAEKIALARSYGDLSENEDYSAARSEQKVVEGRILEIEDILLHAKIIKSGKKDKVDMGSTVSLESDGKINTYILVGAVEANPLEGKVSNESPIGKAIFGKKVGDEVKLPNGKDKKVFEINANAVEKIGSNASNVSVSSQNNNENIVSFNQDEIAQDLIDEDEIPF